MDQAYKGSERRRAKRVKAEFIVLYKIDRPIEVRIWIGNREINAKMLDLSEVGASILTNYDVPISTTLAIKFTLINLNAKIEDRVRSIEVEGEVRYNALLKKNEYRLGIAFTHISQEDKYSIASFVNSAMVR